MDANPILPWFHNGLTARTFNYTWHPFLLVLYWGVEKAANELNSFIFDISSIPTHIWCSHFGYILNVSIYTIVCPPHNNIAIQRWINKFRQRHSRIFQHNKPTNFEYIKVYLCLGPNLCWWETHKYKLLKLINMFFTII